MNRCFEVLFFFAIAFYALTIFSHRMIPKMNGWLVCTLVFAWCSHLTATIYFSFNYTGSLQWTMQTLSGWFAMTIITLHGVLGLCAYYGQSAFNSLFKDFSLWIWTLWLIAFLSGIPTK